MTTGTKRGATTHEATRTQRGTRKQTGTRKAPAAPAYRLDPAAVHAWRVERQLLGRATAATPADVARTLVGVQAQVTSSAALSIALRSPRPRGRKPAVSAIPRALADRALVRSWAMRGTLHLFAADDVPTIAAALGRRDMWRRPAWLRWFGVSEPEMERLIETIGEILDDGRPRTRAELSVEVKDRMGEQAGKLLLGSWGSVLKIASDSNYLVQSAAGTSGIPGRQASDAGGDAGEAGEAGEGSAGVRFVRASRWIPEWREEDPDEALASVVEHANARTLVVSLRREADILELTVRDDGAGFSPDARAGMRLIDMEQRAQLVGGVLVVDSRPGAGTTVRARVPA